MKAHEIPESGRTARGMYAANLPGVALDGDEKISAVIDLKEYAEGRYLLFATRNGIVKKTALPEYDSPRTGLIAINLRGDDELIDVKFTDGEDEVILVSRKGQAIRFKESLARPMGRATGGVIGMRLAEDDQVLAVGLVSEGEELISVTEQGYGKRSKLADYPIEGPRRQGRDRPPAHRQDRPARGCLHRVEGPGHVRDLVERAGGARAGRPRSAGSDARARASARCASRTAPPSSRSRR